MKPVRSLCLALILVVPAILHAGQIYGTIVSGGQPLKGASFEIHCGKESAVTGTTGGDGTYRINVPQEGQCTFTLPGFEGRPSATVFSGASGDRDGAASENGPYAASPPLMLPIVTVLGWSSRVLRRVSSCPRATASPWSETSPARWRSRRCSACWKTRCT